MAKKTLPARVPEVLIARAAFPALYAKARQDLEACWRVDECKTIADKYAAYAVCAKIANDDRLMFLCTRIHERAEYRMGELMREIPECPRAEVRAGSPHTRTAIARRNGVSKNRYLRAMKIAGIPKETFEELLGDDPEVRPPTVTQLEEHPLAINQRLNGPADRRVGFDRRVIVTGIRTFVQFCESHRAADAARLFSDPAVAKDVQHLTRKAQQWLDEFSGKPADEGLPSNVLSFPPPIRPAGT